MTAPWKSLGLQRFVAVARVESVQFSDGLPCREADAPFHDPVARVAYAPDAPSDETINVGLLARTILPTAPDHSLSAIRAHYAVPPDCSVAETVGRLLGFLLEDAQRFEPDLLSLLSQLLPAPTGSLLARLIPLARPEEVISEASRPETMNDEATLSDALELDGPIARGLPAFEDRTGQREMADRVARAIVERSTAVIEAGAGTGKTFGYLIPTLLHLRDHEEEAPRFVVSTRTKQLQEQLCEKDLPFLLPRLAPRAKAALLKGRENYVCLRQWERVLGEVIEGLEHHLLPTLAPLASWLFRTRTGDIDENSAFSTDPHSQALWHRLRDHPRRCVGQACPHIEDCFSMLARRRARAADLVVVNHALLLADQRIGQGILGDYDHLIVDESHALESAARSAFSSTLTAYGLEDVLTSISHRRGRRTAGWLSRLALPTGDRRAGELREGVGALRQMNTRLFSRLAEAFPEGQRGPTPDLSDLRPIADRLAASIERLERRIEGIGETLEAPELQREAEGLVDGLGGVRALLERHFRPSDENLVHWFERREREIVLHATPLDIAGTLSEILYPRIDSLVLASATLSLTDDFAYLKESLGLANAPGRTECNVVPGAFSYRNRMRLYVPEFLPPADGSVEDYAEALAKMLSEIVRRNGRKVLALFTSYQLLHAVRARIAPAIDVLSQGVDGPRSRLLDRFRNSDRGGILLGTDSFWEGVDLPGKNLEILVITRLPFPVPTDPVFAALAERVSSRGRDPFFDLSIPLAVLKLRQGVGRLIRTRKDRGAVVITDRRIVSRGYGRHFTASLPVGEERISDLESLLSDLTTWFSGSTGDVP